LQIVLSARILAFEYSSLVIFDDEFPPTTATAPLFDDLRLQERQAFSITFTDIYQEELPIPEDSIAIQ
jgi:hypothetical protein